MERAELVRALREMGSEFPEPRNVLIVDDEQENLDVLQAVLEKHCKVFVAGSGAEALGWFEKRVPIDVVISDQRMPEMTGVELLSTIADREPETVRMVLTAYSDVEPIVAAINQGSVYRFFLKPWDPHEMTAAVKDALELKAARTALRKSVDLLADRRGLLRKTVRELEDTQDQVLSAERMGTLGRLTSGIAHDIRNQSVALSPLVDAVRLKCQEQEIVTTAEQALRSLDSALRLVTEVSSFARQRAASPARRTAVIMRSFLNETVELFGLEMPDEKHDIQLSLDSKVECIPADPQRLRQGVLALLRNAAAANGAKPIQIKTFEAEDGTVCVQVTDEGQGMDEDTLKKAPKPFFSGFETRGLGLGLEIARLVADDHGGRLELMSAPGEGTIAQLWLGRPTFEPAGARR